MRGWVAESVDEEPLRFIHLRPMGSSQKGIWTGRVRMGYGQYFMGTAPIYLLASAMFRLLKHPVMVGSIAMLWGYVSSAWRGASRYDDREFREFLRRYQYACLRLGKRRATRMVDDAQEVVWRSRLTLTASN
jgi:biofilm PGA synthesis N-glycosyltransferase PgaC